MLTDELPPAAHQEQFYRHASSESVLCMMLRVLKVSRGHRSQVHGAHDDPSLTSLFGFLKTLICQIPPGMQPVVLSPQRWSRDPLPGDRAPTHTWTHVTLTAPPRLDILFIRHVTFQLVTRARLITAALIEFHDNRLFELYEAER